MFKTIVPLKAQPWFDKGAFPEPNALAVQLKTAVVVFCVTAKVTIVEEASQGKVLPEIRMTEN